ncbi:MAG: TlpA family protein disulfide reductase [Gammaproteobacteria bacterium]|nr:TlpA family protein disulfide reductase [Gammaproteobacteria bacterium]
MRLVQYSFFLVMIIFSHITLAAVQDAPSIKLPTANGQVDLATLKGKVVYLDFWASWCKPCKESFPWMHDMKATYKDKGFEVLAVNLDKERKLADEFLKGMDVNFIIAFDETGNTATEYKLRGMPSSYMIGRDGKIYASHIGFREKDKEKMEEVIKQLLDQ